MANKKIYSNLTYKRKVSISQVKGKPDKLPFILKGWGRWNGEILSSNWQLQTWFYRTIFKQPIIPKYVLKYPLAITQAEVRFYKLAIVEKKKGLESRDQGCHASSEFPLWGILLSS